MPTLNWIGKDAVVKRHKHVPFHLLALKALLSCLAGRVKFIYAEQVDYLNGVFRHDKGQLS